MKITIILIGVLVLVAAIFIILTPQQENVNHSVQLAAEPDSVWKKLVDVKEQTAWRKDLKEVELLEGDQFNPKRWLERLPDGTEILFKVVNVEPQKRWEIAFENKIMTGTWSGILSASSNGMTQLEIIENVKVHNPIFRIIFHFSSGLEKFVRHYTEQLAKSFGVEK